MSVHSEFQRITADLVASLRAAQHPACEQLAAALEANAVGAKDDLNGAAQHAVTLCSEPAPKDLAPRYREAYASGTDHLLAICSALLA